MTKLFLSPTKFLAAVRNHQFKTINLFFIKFLAQENDNREIRHVVNFSPNELMGSLATFMAVSDFKKYDFLMALKSILTYIDKQKLLPYLLWEMHLQFDKLNLNLSSKSAGANSNPQHPIKAQDPIRELISDLYTKVSLLLGNNCCAQVKEYKRKKEIIRNMR